MVQVNQNILEIWHFEEIHIWGVELRTKIEKVPKIDCSNLRAFSGRQGFTEVWYLCPVIVEEHPIYRERKIRRARGGIPPQQPPQNQHSLSLKGVESGRRIFHKAVNSSANMSTSIWLPALKHQNRTRSSYTQFREYKTALRDNDTPLDMKTHKFTLVLAQAFKQRPTA